MRILDLGCGEGSGTFMLKKNIGNESKVYGIDINKKNISRANKQYGKKCKFVVATGENLPFKKNFFDEVHAREVLEHVANLPKTLSEINRVLKKGGLLVATFPNKKSEEELVKLNKNYLKQIGHKRIIDTNSDFKKTGFTTKYFRRYNCIEHLYWEYLFKKNYNIINEIGNVDKIIPRKIKLIEELFNPDKKDPAKNMTYKLIRLANRVISPFSRIVDLFFIKKRIKIILEKNG